MIALSDLVRRGLVPAFLILVAAAGSPADARQWRFKGIADPVEADFVAENNGYVVLRGANGKSFEVPLANLSPADQEFIRALDAKPADAPSASVPAGSRNTGGTVQSAESVGGKLLTLDKPVEFHLTSPTDPFGGGSVRFASPDALLVLENVKPSDVIAKYLDRMVVSGAPARPDANVRIVRHAGGSVILPHGPEFPALTVFRNPNLGGKSVSINCYEKAGAAEISDIQGTVGSFLLKRGYMATLAENGDGTGISRNYVAQDHDVVISPMPKGLDSTVRFIRVFPWRWTAKKGIAGNIHQSLEVGWFYDWNIGARSSPDLEYVAIKQKRWWPGMNQDWKEKGINHLLGFNEPDRPDQAKMTVDEAIAGWPELLGTGLRLGSPATSDGGLDWLYQFMEKADRQKLRVDFVAVHYYRGVGNPGDGKSAANQMRNYLKGIHDRVKRPIWITEWNNGANWTKTPEPNESQQKAAIAEMIKMLDETPFVERYALYNWVKDGRMLVRKDGSLTPAGEVYRDRKSPVFFDQPAYSK